MFGLILICAVYAAIGGMVAATLNNTFGGGKWYDDNPLPVLGGLFWPLLPLALLWFPVMGGMYLADKVIPVRPLLPGPKEIKLLETSHEDELDEFDELLKSST